MLPILFDKNWNMVKVGCRGLEELSPEILLVKRESLVAKEPTGARACDGSGELSGRSHKVLVWAGTLPRRKGG